MFTVQVAKLEAMPKLFAEVGSALSNARRLTGL